MFVGMTSKDAMAIPINPENTPIIKVSALNTKVISDFLAPNDLRIPISFVLSSTEMYVIIPIIIDETNKEIEAKAIRTMDIESIIFS